jgi:hypothetical protein
MMKNWKGKQIWTEEETNLLIKEYPVSRKQDLIKLFSRTYSSIHHKASSLGLRNDRGWTSEQTDLLKSLYPIATKREIEKELGKTYQAIMDKAHEIGIYKEPTWTAADEQELRKLYPFHSNVYLSELLGRTRQSVRRKANRLGLVKEKESLRRINSESLRKYTLDEDYFENVDTSDKAYILGFLLGDGNVDKDFFRLSVQIHERDREVLEYIKAQLKSDAPIKKTREHMITLRVSSYKLITDLVKWNMISKKAHILKIPEIREDLYSHLIRGLFDADGSISQGLNKGRCNIRGNGDALWAVSEVVTRQTGVCQMVHKYDGSSIYELQGRTKVSKFAQWLYQDALFYLSRKHSKFAEAGLL